MIDTGIAPLCTYLTKLSTMQWRVWSWARNQSGFALGLPGTHFSMGFNTARTIHPLLAECSSSNVAIWFGSSRLSG
jgi:hypothetical protein